MVALSFSPSKVVKGTSAEYAGISWLLKQGYHVFKNVHVTGFIDVAIFDGKKLIGIDIKSETFRKKNGQKIYRKPSSKQKQYGVKLLFVQENGECYFGSD